MKHTLKVVIISGLIGSSAMRGAERHAGELVLTWSSSISFPDVSFVVISSLPSLIHPVLGYPSSPGWSGSARIEVIRNGLLP